MTLPIAPNVLTPDTDNVAADTSPAVLILPTVALPDTLHDVSVPTLVTCVCEALTLNVVPVNVKPVPALYVPAPLN